MFDNKTSLALLFLCVRKSLSTNEPNNNDVVIFVMEMATLSLQ